MKKRNAFTLIELTITMSAGSALMIMAIGLLHQSMSLASLARKRADHQRSVSRLSNQFRQDVHRASVFTILSSDSIELTLPDETKITYATNERGVLRTHPLGDTATGREAFELIDGSGVRFESLRNPDRAVLTMNHQPIGESAPRVDRQIAAVVGRFVRLENGEASP